MVVPLELISFKKSHISLLNSISTPAVGSSIFDGLGSYYLMAIPFLYVTLPFITLMEPLMNIALNLTLVLTGFACAYVALAIPKTNAEMASALFISLLIAFTGEYVWLGLLIGIFLSIFVVGKQTSSNQS